MSRCTGSKSQQGLMASSQLGLQSETVAALHLNKEKMQMFPTGNNIFFFLTFRIESKIFQMLIIKS